MVKISNLNLGRFITADPLPGNPFDSGSTNRYAYAMNNPIAYEDVSGLSVNKSARQAQPSDPPNPWKDWLDKNWGAIVTILAAIAALLMVFGGGVGMVIGVILLIIVIFIALMYLTPPPGWDGSPTPTPTPSPTPTPTPTTYTVQSGDNIWDIAGKLLKDILGRDPTNQEQVTFKNEILAANPNVIPTQMHAGDVINIPPYIP